MPGQKLTFKEALASMELLAVGEVKKAKKKKKTVRKVKDALVAGGKQTRSGNIFGRGTRKQLKALEKEGY